MPKADDTTTTDDTSVSTELDDESNEDETTLEDIEVDPSDLEDNDDDEVESEEESEEDDESSEEGEPEEEEEPDEESEDPDPKDAVSDEEKLKQFNKEQAEKRIQEKQAREANIKKDQDQYLESAEDDKDLAVRQLQIDAYNNKVERNTNNLTNGYEKAINDFDILSNEDPVVQAEVNAAIDSFQALHVQIDRYGNPIQVGGNLYEHLKNKAESISKLTGIGVKTQKDSKTREKSKVTPTPTRAPKEAKKDPMMEAFDEEAGL